MTTTSIPDSPRILLLAHSCNPEIGSEPIMGWNRALQAARYFNTWVLCDEEFNRAAIERYVAKHGPTANLHFVFVPPGKWEGRLNRLPGMFYASYNLWHRRAFKIAKKLHEELRFDLVHQLTLCGFREPGYLWKLDAPFVWGPVGGAQNYPCRFLASAGLKGAVSESIRSILNIWQMHYARRIGRAARRAAVLLTANSTNARELARRPGVKPRVMLETGIHPFPNPPRQDFRHGGALRLLWSGVFEHRKALHLLLHALAAIPADVPYELRILGRGPLEKRWKKIAERLKMNEHCRWLGWVDYSQARDHFLWADAFVFTSLRDTTGNVNLEAVAAGTPILCLDHQGVGDIVDDTCGVKLPVTTPREVIAGLRDTLVGWSRDPSELERLSNGALQRAAYYGWNEQGDQMAAVYREVLGMDELQTSPIARHVSGDFVTAAASMSMACCEGSSAAYSSDEAITARRV